MTESTPRLPQASSDVSNYAPYSLMAVLAVVVAVLFAVLLIVMGISAWMIGQPMVEPILLVFPVAAIVLAFAGRKQIDNSEGTRVGLKFCRMAWWISIIGMIGYIAYIIGVNVATRSDAEEAFNRWAKTVAKANPTDWKNVDLNTSFHATLPPEKQPSVNPNDTVKLMSLYYPQFLAFRQSDIVRLSYRNRDQMQFDVQGLEEWKHDKLAMNCRLTVNVKCPEGEFVMSAAMHKTIIDGKPQPVWQVLPPQNETTTFLRPLRFTAYGERIRDIEIAAHHLVYEYFLTVVASKAQHGVVFERFRNETPDPKAVIDDLLGNLHCRLALTGGMMWNGAEPGANSPEWWLKAALSGGLNVPESRHRYHVAAREYFEPLDVADPQQEQFKRTEFIGYWRFGEFRRAGQVIPKNPDVGIILIPGADAWYARVPIEIQPPGAGQIACRGHVVLKLDNKQFLAEMEATKKDTTMTEVKYRATPAVPVPWKVVRIESDLKPQAPPRPQQQD